MKCPRTFDTNVSIGGKLRITGAPCIKEECAWWDSTFEHCDPTGLAHTLERLTDVLSLIEDEMPKWRQFTK